MPQQRPSVSPETECQILIRMRAGGVQAASALGNEFGLSGQHVEDLFRVDREKRGWKIPQRCLTDDQRTWAIQQRRTGIKVKIMASTLAVSESVIYNILRLERHKTTSSKPSISSPVSTVEIEGEETEEESELEDLSAELEEVCFWQELRRVEYWITDMRDHLVSHKEQTPGEFFWQSLEESGGIFSDSVEMIRRVEMRRTRKLQKIFGTLSEDREKIHASLSQFGPAVDNHPRVNLTLKFMHSNSPELEVTSHSKYPRMDTPCHEENQLLR